MFQGNIVVLVTPMHVDGGLDIPSFQQLIEWHLASGSHGIVVAGTTGESGALTTEEKRQLIKIAVDMVKNRVPVIAGTGASGTHNTIALTQMAMEEGVDACLLMSPPYVKPTQEGLYLHHKAVAEAVPIPQILYNVPGRTACDLLPETVERLSHIPNIVGIKEATGDITRASKILLSCGDRLDVYSGDDATTLDMMLIGGKGVLSVTANVAPELMNRMCEAALEKNVAVAKSINEKLELLHHALFVEANPIPVKWALHQLGRISAGIRLPLTPLSSVYHEKLRVSLQQADIRLNV